MQQHPNHLQKVRPALGGDRGNRRRLLTSVSGGAWVIYGASCAHHTNADLNIPLSLTQSIFSSTQKAAMPPLTQSAASILGRSVMKYSTLCKPVDALLEGGLKPGFVLEISGPPGTRKEALAVNLTRTFVEANKGVIFVGRSSPCSFVGRN